MALSKSSPRRKAQNLSVCHLCEENPNIRRKCVDYTLWMCNNCKTQIHSKFKSADDYAVIGLKDVEFGQQTVEYKLRNIPCGTHCNQNVCLYCKNCNKVACPSCVSEEHTKHDLDSLSKIYEGKVDKLRFLKDELDAHLHYFMEDERKLENHRLTERSRYENVKQAILKQTAELKKAVDFEAAKRLQDLESSWVEVDESISSIRANCLRFQQDIRSKLSSLKTTLDGDDIETLIQMENNLPASWIKADKSTLTACHSFKEFHPGTIDKSKISNMLGSLQPISESETQLNIIHSCRTNFDIVAGLYPCKDRSVLVYDESVSSMKTMKFEKNKITVIQETKGMRVFDIAETEQGEFVLSFVDKTTLKRLHFDGTFEDFVDLSPLLPRALHYTRSGKLLLSVREQGKVFPVPLTSQRKLIVMQSNGKQIHEYHTDDQNKRLFSMVYRITTAKNNNIYLIDRMSNDGLGCIVALSYPNNIVWKYNGHESINTDSTKPFQPRDIVTTDTENIIVSDLKNFVIHILNSQGSLKSFIDTSDQGIIYPHSLAIDVSGLLWIGCTTHGANQGAMLYVVKFSGF